jgi:hypothetical protein
MVNATPIRGGQINGAGDVDALFLKVFGGEVLTAFERANIALPYTMSRTIASGRSAQFPMTGQVGGGYHPPGAEIRGLPMNLAEQIITIDDLLISHGFFASIDEAKAHYDYRAAMSEEMGRFLATAMDQHILQLGVLAARAATPVTGLTTGGGTRIGTNYPGAPASANYLTNGDHLAEAIILAAQAMDEKDVPKEGRVAFVRPAQYYALVRATRNLNSDFGSRGSWADGTVLEIGGVRILMTNNLPSTDMSAVTDWRAGTANKYRGNFVNVAGLVLQMGAIGTVKLMDLAMEAAYDIRRQGTLVVGKYAVGHGILRPNCAAEIINATAIQP